MGGGQDGGGSVISAFTMRTEYAKGSVSGGGGGGANGMGMGFDDGGGGGTRADGGDYGRGVPHTAGRSVSSKVGEGKRSSTIAGRVVHANSTVDMNNVYHMYVYGTYLHSPPSTNNLQQ